METLLRTHCRGECMLFLLVCFYCVTEFIVFVANERELRESQDREQFSLSELRTNVTT